MSAFVAVYEEGSINRAAQRLEVAQPSVSNLIRNLESELGVQLFERLTRGTKPTPSGEIFYSHSQRVLAEADAAVLAVTGRSERVAGLVNVGLAATAARGLLPNILGNYLEEFPEVELQISEGYSGTLIEWTLSGQVDFAVVAVAPVDRRLRVRQLVTDQLLLVSSPAQAERYANVSSLADGPPMKMAIPSGRNRIRSVIDSYIHANKLPVDRSVEIDSLQAVLEFVRRNDWVTIVPATAVINELERKEIGRASCRERV